MVGEKEIKLRAPKHVRHRLIAQDPIAAAAWFHAYRAAVYECLFGWDMKKVFEKMLPDACPS